MSVKSGGCITFSYSWIQGFPPRCRGSLPLWTGSMLWQPSPLVAKTASAAPGRLLISWQPQKTKRASFSYWFYTSPAADFHWLN